MKVGVAISSSTPVAEAPKILRQIDLVLLMENFKAVYRMAYSTTTRTPL